MEDLKLQNALLAGEIPAAETWQRWMRNADARAANPQSMNQQTGRRTMAVAQQVLPLQGAQVPAEVWAQMMGNLAPSAGAQEVAPDAVWNGALQAAATNDQTGLAVLLLAQRSGVADGQQASAQARMTALTALNDVPGVRAMAAAFLADSLGDTVAQLGAAEELAMPAPPTMSGVAVAPTKGRDIGGGQANGVVEHGPQVDDALILPPPRAPEPATRKTSAKTNSFKRLQGPVAPHKPLVAPVAIDALEPAAGVDTPRTLPFSLFRAVPR